MDYETLPAEQVADLKPGQPHYGVNRPGAYDPDKRGYLRAVDPLTGKAKWSIPFKSPNICDTLVTGGGLVFTGQLTGEFIAVDSDTGMILWQFQTPSGVVGQPNLLHVPAGGTQWTFKLFEEYAPQRTSSVQ
jgi:alcohol dehydrogenase (cytochrome c)